MNYFNDVRDSYFDELEDEFDNYYPDKPEDVPEFVFGTQVSEISDSTSNFVSRYIVDFIDSDVPELCTEDHYFSEMVNDDEMKQFMDDIKAALQKLIKTVGPNYSEKYEFRKPYEAWLKDNVEQGELV